MQESRGFLAGRFLTGKGIEVLHGDIRKSGQVYWVTQAMMLKKHGFRGTEADDRECCIIGCILSGLSNLFNNLTIHLFIDAFLYGKHRFFTELILYGFQFNNSYRR